MAGGTHSPVIAHPNPNPTTNPVTVTPSFSLTASVQTSAPTIVTNGVGSENASRSSETSSASTGMLVGVVAAALVLVIVVSIWLYCRRSKGNAVAEDPCGSVEDNSKRTAWKHSALDTPSARNQNSQTPSPVDDKQDDQEYSFWGASEAGNSINSDSSGKCFLPGSVGGDALSGEEEMGVDQNRASVDTFLPGSVSEHANLENPGHSQVDDEDSEIERLRAEVKAVQLARLYTNIDRLAMVDNTPNAGPKSEDAGA
jgi:hypothetical protein